MKPNFLIIGAAKSGTTSLAVNLSAHPQVYLAPGEVHFFGSDEEWARGTAAYEASFDKAPSGAVAVGEKSPSYLYSPDAPHRIAQVLADDERFCCIAILREPVARAVSQVAHRQRLGEETKTAAEAVTDNLDGVEGTFDYIGHGHYAEQLQRYVEAVGADRVHVEFYEDLVDDPAALFERLCTRLGLRPHAFRQAARRMNESATIRYPRLYRELIRIRAGRWLPPRLARWVWGQLQQPVTYDTLPEAVAARARDHFVAHNRELEVLLGRPVPDAWRLP